MQGRIDWQRSWANSFILTGDVYSGDLRAQLAEVPVSSTINVQDHQGLFGGFLLGRWEHKGAASDMALQGYFSEQTRFELNSWGHSRTLDVDFQQHHHDGSRQDVLFGGEYRFTDDQILAQRTLRSVYVTYLIDSFVQDENALVPAKLMLMMGTKLQQGTLAGLQIQPSVRLLFSPSDRQLFWAAASHAAVADSIEGIGLDVDTYMGRFNGMPLIMLLDGNPRGKPEFVNAFESGYRRRLNRTLSVNAASFYNRYTRLNSVISGAPIPSTEYPGAMDEPTTYINGFDASTAGLETAAMWKPAASFDVALAYTWMQAHGHQSQPGNVTIVDSWSSPRNSGSSTVSWEFLRN